MIPRERAKSTKTWYSCSECNIVSYYYIHDDGTTSLPISELAHHSKVVAGLSSKKEALKYLLAARIARATGKEKL